MAKIANAITVNLFLLLIRYSPYSRQSNTSAKFIIKQLVATQTLTIPKPVLSGLVFSYTKMLLVTITNRQMSIMNRFQKIMNFSFLVVSHTLSQGVTCFDAFFEKVCDTFLVVKQLFLLIYKA